MVWAFKTRQGPRVINCPRLRVAKCKRDPAGIFGHRRGESGGQSSRVRAQWLPPPPGGARRSPPAPRPPDPPAHPIGRLRGARARTGAAATLPGYPGRGLPPVARDLGSSAWERARGEHSASLATRPARRNRLIPAQLTVSYQDWKFKNCERRVLW